MHKTILMKQKKALAFLMAGGIIFSTQPYLIKEEYCLESDMDIDREQGVSKKLAKKKYNLGYMPSFGQARNSLRKPNYYGSVNESK